MSVIVTERQAEQVLRKRIAEIKSELNLDYTPSFKRGGNIVSDHLNIQVREGQHPFVSGEGLYTAGPPPSILIDKRLTSPERRNFTFYHEVAHHLIRQNDALYSFIHEHAHNRFDDVLEHFCNVGAAEFLLPLEAIREHIQQGGFSIDLIRELDRRYPASKPAIAIQLTQAAGHKCIILVCEYGVMPMRQAQQQAMVDSQAQACLFIQYASSSPTCKYSCGRYAVVPKTHLIYGAFESGKYLRGQDRTLFKSGRNYPVHCEAFGYRNQVFAEFRFSDPISNNQLALF